MATPTFRFSLIALLALLALCIPGFDSQANSGNGKDRSFDRFIVKFKPGSASLGKSVARQHILDNSARAHGAGVAQLRRLAVGADVVRTSRKLDFANAQAFMNRLRSDPNVEYVEIDRRLKPTFTPNDSLYAANQWHYFEPTGGINLPAAWDLASGSGVVVAVLDTGITAHSDLDANIVPGYDFISDLATAGDGNGRDSDPGDPGDWTTTDQCDPLGSVAQDSSWHGTHVAGTVAAVTNNAKGVAGVAFNAKVMPLRVLGHCGGYNSDIADAVVWASGGSVPGVASNPNPVEVINMSLGGPGACGATAQAAINAAVAAGSVVVVAAGNDADDAAGYEPSNCDNVIVVGASQRNGGRAVEYSNYGPAVDVSAPGGGAGDFIASTFNKGLTVPGAEGYIGFQGTSMAAPHVAGTVALMQSALANTPGNVETILKSTARALPVACPEGCGAGIVNAAAAISQAAGGVLGISDQTVTEGNSGTSLATFTVSLSKPMPAAVTFNLATANGSATAGSDYNAMSLTGQSIAAGATSKTFSISINGDTTPESLETFFVNVSNVSGITAGKVQGTGTILNDDAIALSNGVAAGPYNVVAGQSMLYTLEVPAGRTSLSFTTAGGSGDADLYVKFGSPPTTSVADCASEGIATDETCSLTPQVGTWYVLVSAYADFTGVTLTGQYLPVALATPGISIADAAVSEGNAGSKLLNFTLSLSQASTSPVSFDIATASGTASAGSDYVALSTPGQVIPAGQTSASFSVTINGDTAVEANETFTVNLANVSGALVADGQAQGRINNDDVALLSIDDVSVAEGSSGLSTATFIVRLSSPQPNPVTFDITTGNGTATAGSDYVARSQAGRFLDAGRTTQLFEVSIVGDAISEAAETFNVTISNVNGATLADGTAVGTIGNDDAVAPTPTASIQRIVTVLPLDDSTAARERQWLKDCKALQARRARAGRSTSSCVLPEATRRASRGF